MRSLLGSFSVVWTVGYVMANVLGMHYADAAPDAWRWLLASAGVPALCVLVLAATVKAMVDLQVWRKRRTLRGEGAAGQ